MFDCLAAGLAGARSPVVFGMPRCVDVVASALCHLAQARLRKAAAR